MKQTRGDQKERLAAALRENLKKRKARERALALGKGVSSRATPKPKPVGERGPNAAKKAL